MCYYNTVIFNIFMSISLLMEEINEYMGMGI